MCSYNAVNGVPSCANNWLLTDVARGEWGFDGYITSDCDADANVFDPHRYTRTPEETVQAVLRAGTGASERIRGVKDGCSDRN
jgi:beta-D-xylosidase 4